MFETLILSDLSKKMKPGYYWICQKNGNLVQKCHDASWETKTKSLVSGEGRVKSHPQRFFSVPSGRRGTIAVQNVTKHQIPDFGFHNSSDVLKVPSLRAQIHHQVVHEPAGRTKNLKMSGICSHDCTLKYMSDGLQTPSRHLKSSLLLKKN